MVYYLKYRPQTVEELNLVRVRTRLAAILASEEIPHAFLFSGPRGLGKTSSARILAREIHGKKLTQEMLDQISRGSHPDVLEIDAASNRGIDEIRELRERVKYAPMELPKKVYIIDEVHMLTREAFNALLKTLEEPPSHVVFILATTEPWKLPETIMSRVFQVQFEKPTQEELVSSLVRIVEGEGLEVEDGVLDRVALLADGAFRDAAKILEELVVVSGGKKITQKVLEETYLTGTFDQASEKLIESLAKNDKALGFGVVDSLEGSGVDFELFIQVVTKALHEQLMETARGNKAQFTTEELQQLLELFIVCYQQTKISPLPRLPLEMLIVKWCDRGNEVRVQVVEKKVEGRDVEVSHKKREIQVEKQRQDRPELLKDLIAAIDSQNKMLGGILRGVRLDEIGDGSVELLAISSFHEEKINELSSKKMIEDKLSEICGEETHVTVKISK